MFKRITYSLFAAAVAYGAIANNSLTGYTPRISEQELENAQRAPVYTQCVKPGQVAFTFDDGPNPTTTSKVLKFLKEKNIIGTFFITAQNQERTDSDKINLINDQASIDIVKQTVREGHIIGSHTFYHEDLFGGLENGRMEMNIDTMTDKIEEIIGVKPIFFRPPLGNGGYDFDDEDPINAPKNERVQKYLGASGFKIIMWGADTRDWENKENVDADIVELNKNLSPEKASPETDSFIILMHDIYDTTADLALPKVYDYITGLGYTIVSLPECLGMTNAYQDGMEPNGLDYNLNTNDVTSNSTTSNSTVPTFNNSQTPMAQSSASNIHIKMIYSVFISIIFSLLFLY